MTTRQWNRTCIDAGIEAQVSPAAFSSAVTMHSTRVANASALNLPRKTSTECPRWLDAARVTRRVGLVPRYAAIGCANSAGLAERYAATSSASFALAALRCRSLT